MTKPNPERVTLKMTRTQAALVRSILFSELADAADVLADQARAAADGAEVAGEDALGTFRQRVSAVADSLDIMGWSSRGDLDRLLAQEQARRTEVVV